MTLSIVIPAKNEAQTIRPLLGDLAIRHPEAEIIVVDDGSTDDTAKLAADAGARVISHPYSMGNGAAIKSGARAATGGIIVFMDADGQHRPEDIGRLLQVLASGYDLVVGARTLHSHASLGRRLANQVYNGLASWMVGHHIADLTSGFRAVRAERFREFLHLLPNGFSYPTTSTMAFFRAGYSVAFEPIEAQRRIGKSHIRATRDAFRFLVILLRIGTLYSPFRLFLPVAGTFFGLALLHYLSTWFTGGPRFTSMTAFLFITSVLVFLIGIVSEQITMLLYSLRRPAINEDTPNRG